ncbi:MAG: hypothetical protein P4M08_00915 [Oligoflexia bacterium]|nr:hypothetical protein [Oligoflexia bacterium]
MVFTNIAVAALIAYGIFGVALRPSDTFAQTESEAAENLPDIEARLYRVQTETMSTSKAVYLLKRLAASKRPPDQTGEADSIPAERKLLVLKTGETNVMALRVLRDLPDTNEIIVKKIREYGQGPTLPIGETYVAVEKISDVMPPPPTEQDKKDMEEVSPPPAYDPELDAGTSPTQGTTAGAESEDERILGLAVRDDDIKPFRRNWVSAVFGLFRNNPGGEPFDYYQAGGIRYQYDFMDRIYFKEGKARDTFGIEGAMSFYKVVNLLANGGDSYLIVPVSVVARYVIYPTETWGFAFYGGLLKNFVSYSVPSGASAADTANVINYADNFGQPQLAVGAGVLYNLGPGWYVRADLGLDMLTVGLALHF